MKYLTPMHITAYIFTILNIMLALLNILSSDPSKIAVTLNIGALFFCYGIFKNATFIYDGEQRIKELRKQVYAQMKTYTGNE